jgi:serine/threonine protein kinase
MSASEQLQPESQVDHYLLEKQIGSGSSGEVWLANDGARHVALKFVHEHLLQGPDAERHRRHLNSEIHALETLAGHPHIPTFYGYNLHNSRPYLAMQYIATPAYDQLISSGEMMLIPIKRRLRVLGMIARTINDIHARGIIHRDIKPSNIRGVDSPHIIDFSVAFETQKVLQADTNIGTGIYMPPPDDHPPDELMDNYGFALVAYEVLFGQHAIFTAQNTGQTVLETRQRAREYIQYNEWRMPTRLTPNQLPGNLRGADLAELERVFQRALGERDVRYRDMQDFISDLRDAILIPDNLPYIEYVPDLPIASEVIPFEEDYTLHEVSRAKQATNINESSSGQPHPQPNKRRWLVISLVMLTIIGGIGAVILLLSGSG